MLEAVQHFVEECKPNGLFIIDKPTGDGKTHDALQYIATHFNSDEEQVFFYLTPLTKNLNDAYSKLEEFFIAKEKKEEFDLFAIKIQSNVDSVIGKLNDVSRDFKEPFKSLPTFRSLRDAVAGLSGMDKQTLFYADALKIIREAYEPEFRNDVIATLMKDNDFKSRKVLGRIKYIKEKYPFLISVYPSIESKKKRIFFMTMDKFYYGNSTIVENGYRFLNNSLIKGAIIFIDEIDSTKRTILDKQIDDSVHRKVDIFKMFRQINNSLQNTITPANILNQLDEETKFKSVETLEKIRVKFKTDYDKYGLNKLFKYDLDDKNRSFLFNDFTVHTYSKKIGYELIIKDDNNEKIHIITAEKKHSPNNGLESKDKKLEQCIQAIKGLVSYFVTGIAIISGNYLNWYNYSGKTPESEDIETESAISTVLTSFDLDHSIKKILTNMIANNFNNFNKSKNRKSISVVNSDFYEEGFRYYSFVNQIDHNETTNITMVDLFDTPENFLWQITSKALVIGLSATGTIETVTGNYDLDYLKRKLGKKYYVVRKEDFERMKVAFEEKQKKNLAPIKVHVIPPKDTFSTQSDSEKPSILISLLSDNEETQGKMLQIVKTNEEHNNNQQRFLKVMMVIKDFLLNRKSKALLILTNRNAKSDDSDLFSKEFIEKFIDLVEKEQDISFEYSIVLLYGKEFDEKKKDIGRVIKTKKKAIILSSYPSSGTGQNLQYETEDENGEIKNQDIDSIYVEKPTNMLVNTNNGLSEENLLKYIYQIEALGQVGDIAPLTVEMAVSFGFKKYAGTESEQFTIKKVYKTASINNNLVINLNQAIGRICRTKEKKNEINIYIDDEILPIDFSCVKGKCLNREFLALVDEAEKSKVVPSYSLENKTQNQNNRNCYITNLRIQRIINGNYDSWTEENMIQWEELRQLVIMNPTINEDELMDPKNSKYFSLYVKALPNKKIDRCFYSGNSKSVSYIKNEEYKNEVSFESSHLKDLLQNSCVKDFYLSKGYPTSFYPADYVLNPVAFNQIYKGMIGEAIGKMLLEKIGINLLEIHNPEKFEKFDFVLDNDPNIYFDFKFWNDRSAFSSFVEEMSSEEETKKIQRKIDAVNAKKVFIINILSNECYKCKTIGKDHNIYLIPSLINEKTNKANTFNTEYIKRKLYF